ncbi:MAG: hypothetical protein M1819_001548 [Sarea resinae]|nr:MAG: hypothetical protein M1819_001548 [Sarea resinae]
MDEDFDQSPEVDDDDALVLQLSSHTQSQDQSNASKSPSFPQSDYRHSSVSTLGRSLSNNGLPARRPSLPDGDQETLHPRPRDAGTIDPQQFRQQLYGAVYDSPPSSAIESRLSSVATDQQNESHAPYPPLKERALPPRDVTDDTIDDAYVAFILYCNPSVPLSSDSTALRNSFRSPPRSDGKSFSTYTLLELIKRLESKDIKTWTQLAIELGVEPPDKEKNQSTQKVQQYAVRLKRWMHAMHVDAFFEYCQGKPHPYYTQLPSSDDPHPENGRDGVPIEEDLAVRALLPEFRPKRGRRKTENTENENDQDESTPKRPRLDTSVGSADADFESAHSALFPSSAIPSSAHPDGMGQFMDHLRWPSNSAITPNTLSTAKYPTPHPMSATPTAGIQFKWRLNEPTLNTAPSTPHPLSAITPASAYPPDSAFEEPQSAVTPSGRGRPRRKHGPAVSSAWPGSINSLTGKFRGRPPNNRSVRDGPFSTFSVNLKGKDEPGVDSGGGRPPVAAGTPNIRQGFSSSPSHPFSGYAKNAEALPTPPPLTAQPGRPSRLQVQVPQHTGGKVQLVTPTLLVNGESNDASTKTHNQHLSPSSFFREPQEPASAHHPQQSQHMTIQNSHPAQLSATPTTASTATSPQIRAANERHLPPRTSDLENLISARLLTTKPTNGLSPIPLTEAKILAREILRSLRSGLGGPTPPPPPPSLSTGVTEESYLATAAAAAWLGFYDTAASTSSSSSSSSGIPASPATVTGTRGGVMRELSLSIQRRGNVQIPSGSGSLRPQTLSQKEIPKQSGNHKSPPLSNTANANGARNALESPRTHHRALVPPSTPTTTTAMTSTDGTAAAVETPPVLKDTNSTTTYHLTWTTQSYGLTGRISLHVSLPLCPAGPSPSNASQSQPLHLPPRPSSTEPSPSLSLSPTLSRSPHPHPNPSAKATSSISNGHARSLSSPAAPAGPADVERDGKAKEMQTQTGTETETGTEDWRRKYEDVCAVLREKEDEIWRLRRGVLDAVM